MLNANKTVDEIKNDTTYSNGPFLIKVGEHYHELYEKRTDVTTSEGYLYNRTYSNVVIDKLGKYGQVL